MSRNNLRPWTILLSCVLAAAASCNGGREDVRYAASTTFTSDPELSGIPMGVRTNPLPAAPDEYQDGSGKLYLAFSWVQSGASLYQAWTGEWPDTWSQVVDAGFVQVPVHGIGGELVDPDDGQIDFPGDVVYRRNGANDRPEAAVQLISGLEPYVRSIPKRTAAYRDLLPQLEGTTPGFDFDKLMTDERYYHQLALIGMFRRALEDYKMLRGHYPATFDALLASGSAPFDASSVNPLTGLLFTGDGSVPLDFEYEYVSRERCALHPVLANGSKLNFTFTW